eukprot:UN2700
MVSDILDNRENQNKEAIPNVAEMEKQDLDISICGITIPIKDVFYTHEMRKMRKTLADSWVLVGFIIAFGTMIMKWLEDWPVDRSFYWACVTVTTVGFGDVVPTTNVAKWFTIFYMIVGTIMVARSVTNIASIPLAMRRLRMQQDVLAQTEDLEAVHKLIKADTLDRLGLREVKNDLSKAEFVIQMLLLLDSVNERELTSCCR